VGVEIQIKNAWWYFWVEGLDSIPWRSYSYPLEGDSSTSARLGCSCWVVGGLWVGGCSWFGVGRVVWLLGGPGRGERVVSVGECCSVGSWFVRCCVVRVFSGRGGGRFFFCVHFGLGAWVECWRCVGVLLFGS